MYNLSIFLQFSQRGHFPTTAFTVELLLRTSVLKIKITSFRILSLSTPAMASRIVKSPAVQVIQRKLCKFDNHFGTNIFQTTAKRQFAAQASIARTEKELLKAEPLKVKEVFFGTSLNSKMI